TKNDFDMVSVIQSHEFRTKDHEFIRGEIRDIDRESIELRAYERYRGNDWDGVRRYSRRINLSLSPEAAVFDARGEGKVMPVDYDDFIYGRFTGEYKDDYLLAQIRGDQVQAITIYRGIFEDEDGKKYKANPFIGDKVSIGRVSSVNGHKITMDRVQDWSPPMNRWRKNPHDLGLDTTSALVYDERGQRIEPGALHPTDILYAVHDMKKALIIFVQ
ncbi:MAG: hypothetical protein GX318_07465, partial [Clostridia bacterium]|nr:hypothetical protein [Clostridia bacterium]